MSYDMKVSVIYKKSKPNQVVIKTSNQDDPWMDLGLLLEGIGVLVQSCQQQGYIEHKGQPVNEYLKDYIDKVCHDYGSKNRLDG